MRKLNHSAKTVKLGALSVLLIIAALFAVYNLTANNETPAGQISRLSRDTAALTDKLLAGHSYSRSTPSSNRCINQGKDSWSLRGGDTIHCFYEVKIHTDATGSELRKRIEQAGGWRGLYSDGSGSDYTLTYKDAHCSISDGNTYHSQETARNNFANGYLNIDCQNFTDQKHSPLPASTYPAD